MNQGCYLRRLYVHWKFYFVHYLYDQITEKYLKDICSFLHPGMLWLVTEGSYDAIKIEINCIKARKMAIND